MEIIGGDKKEEEKLPEKLILSIEFSPETHTVTYNMPQNIAMTRFLFDQLEILIKGQTAMPFQKPVSLVDKPNLLNKAFDSFKKRGN